MSRMTDFLREDTPPTEFYPLSLHDALPISTQRADRRRALRCERARASRADLAAACCRTQRRRTAARRSEEHTSELQSRLHLVCRLPLEKKKRRATAPVQRAEGFPAPVETTQ